MSLTSKITSPSGPNEELFGGGPKLPGCPAYRRVPSLLFFDAEYARTRLVANPWIADAADLWRLSKEFRAVLGVMHLEHELGNDSRLRLVGDVDDV